MIADFKSFIERERPHWEKLERELDRMREHLADTSDLAYMKVILSLFQRASSDLARIQGYSAEPELKSYLENLVGAGYAEIHSSTRDRRRLRPWHWFVRTFPQTFRRQIWGFKVALALTVAGALLGGVLLGFDIGNKSVVYGFSYLAESTPHERVQMEESGAMEKFKRSSHSGHATFSAFLMQNNIGVALRALALGLTWGLGTVIVLFYNGVQLGAVIYDYVRDGQSVFLAGSILPHGSFEIPAILVAGQAGLVLGRALIGWGSSEGLRTRMRIILPDLTTLAGGASVMLVWAGIVESFFSQYHYPVVPYSLKISFGIVELAALYMFLTRAGKPKEDPK